MPTTAQEIFERYVWAGAMTQNADAVAELFAADGVIEAPLVPAGLAYPRRMEGREQIRQGLAAFYQRGAIVDRRVNTEKSGYVLHTTADPEVFIVEIDTVFEDETGEITTMSLVQIFHTRDGKITLLRDYFAPDQAD